MKILFKTLAIIIVPILLLFIVLWIKSPGTTAPITNEAGEIMPNSIAAIEKVNIGGIEQTLII